MAPIPHYRAPSSLDMVNMIADAFFQARKRIYLLFVKLGMHEEVMPFVYRHEEVMSLIWV
jgi:DNA polymerase III delta prime subunit